MELTRETQDGDDLWLLRESKAREKLRRRGGPALAAFMLWLGWRIVAAYMQFVDGPEGALAPMSRFPALPVLRDCLAQTL